MVQVVLPPPHREARHKAAPTGTGLTPWRRAALERCAGWNGDVFPHGNGGGRSRIEAAILQGLGVRRGMPDIGVINTGRILFVELKSDRGKLSVAQQECHEALRLAGCPVEVCRSLDEVIAALRKHGVPLRMSAPRGVAATCSIQV